MQSLFYHDSAMDQLCMIMQFANQMCACVCVCVLSHVQLLEAPWTVAHQAPLSTGCSRQEYWSGLPCASSVDLPDPEIKPVSYVSCIGRWALYHWRHLGSPSSYL